MAFFPGCLVLQRMPQYEKAARTVLRELDIQLEDIPFSACCGAPLESFTDEWRYLAAYNLSLAVRMELDILALCGNCANTLSRAIAALEDPVLSQQVNERLETLGLRYEPRVRVKHLLWVISEHLETLRQRVTNQLSLRAALTYPCQAFRPPLTADVGGALGPQTMRKIVELTGAEVISYDAEYDCCGSALYLADEELALEAGRRKLSSVAGADVLVDACGNCQLLLERFQGLIRRGMAELNLPAMTLPQLLGLAMGIDPAELGIAEAQANKILHSSA